MSRIKFKDMENKYKIIFIVSSILSLIFLLPTTIYYISIYVIEIIKAVAFYIKDTTIWWIEKFRGE